jgi:DNA-binding PadR family transcriptional regulator
MEKELYSEVRKLTAAFKSLAHPESCLILIILKQADKEISFSEIYNKVNICLGKKVNPNCIWRGLEALKKAGLLTEKKLMEINPETGRSRVRFYRLNAFGERILNWLLTLEEIRGLENVVKGVKAPFLFGNIYILVNLNTYLAYNAEREEGWGIQGSQVIRFPSAGRI